jgi:hypothetical protein
MIGILLSTAINPYRRSRHLPHRLHLPRCVKNPSLKVERQAVSGTDFDFLGAGCVAAINTKINCKKKV